MLSAAPAVPHISVQRLDPAAQLPRYAHAGPFGDLAADLHAIAPPRLHLAKPYPFRPASPLGCPAGFGALLADRSGVALRGLHTLAGLIDPGFRGELKVILHNLSTVPQSIAAGDRIAQMRVVPLVQATFAFADSLDETERHTRGFGSTGV